MSDKKAKGQFYTVHSDYILNGLPGPPPAATRIVEPFAGQGDLLTWLQGRSALPVEAYDIDPKRADIQQRDTLLHPPDYTGAWILTNPPYLARNKSTSKTVFDKYDTNDLYKCFMLSLAAANAAGGILIIPAGFFLSPRDLDVRVRTAFLSKYRLLAVRYFEEDVFPDTSTTVVAVAFSAASAARMSEQHVPWTFYPSKQSRTFALREADDWIIGGDVYTLPVPAAIQVRRWVEGATTLREGEQLTELTLCALDSGTAAGRIRLEYRAGYRYPAKDTSRSYATLCLHGRTLTADEQKQIATRFNDFVEQKRSETWSLFLPQYRESKEYSRKRMPFDLAYRIVAHLIGTMAS